MSTANPYTQKKANGKENSQREITKVFHKNYFHCGTAQGDISNNAALLQAVMALKEQEQRESLDADGNSEAGDSSSQSASGGRVHQEAVDADYDAIAHFAFGNMKFAI